MAKAKLDPKAPRRKWKLRRWFLKHGGKKTDIPKGFKWRTPRVGDPARTLIKMVQRKAKLKHISGQFDEATRDLLFPNAVPSLHIIAKSYRWAHPLTTRSGKPKGIVWHHAAASSCTADQIHQWHLGNGWSGIGYHFFVSKEGKVYRGRPESKLGGHTLNASNWLGVCAEGNYASESMPAAQLKALQGLHRYLHRKYDGIADKKHKDMPGNSTACPGAKYPFAKVISVK